jgi:hypothetical protein
MIAAGVPAGASRPFQPILMMPGMVSSIVGVQFRKPRLLGDGDDADQAGLRLRQGRRQRVERHLHVAGEEVLHQWRAAAVGNVHHLDSGLLLEQFAHDVVHRADAGTAIGELAGILLRVVDELAHVVNRQGRMHGENEGDVRGQRDRRKCRSRVERKVFFAKTCW